MGRSGWTWSTAHTVPGWCQRSRWISRWFWYCQTCGREGGLQCRHTDAGSGQAEQLHELAAQGTGRTADRTTARIGLELALTGSLTPIAQGPRRNTQAAGCVRGGDTKSCRPVAAVEDRVSGPVFGLTARLLAGRTTSARRRDGRVGLIERHLDGRLVTWPFGVHVGLAVACVAGERVGRFFYLQDRPPPAGCRSGPGGCGQG